MNIDEILTRDFMLCSECWWKNTPEGIGFGLVIPGKCLENGICEKCGKNGRVNAYRPHRTVKMDDPGLDDTDDPVFKLMYGD